MATFKVELVAESIGIHMRRYAPSGTLPMNRPAFRIGIRYATVDIEFSAALEAFFDTCIPVLRREDGTELAWPVDLGELRAFAGVC